MSAILVGLAVPASADTASDVRSDADWILTAQLADGAIAHHVDRVKIWPYLANFAALGLARARTVTGSAKYSDASWRWLSWYQAHEDAQGFVTDYSVSPTGVETSTGDMDSTDAYAGTFLLAARNTWKATGELAKLTALKSGISGAVRAIEATQDTDGLTWAKPAWHVKYLMDQAEAFAGLQAAAEMAQAYGDTTTAQRASADAAKLKAGIDGLWNAAVGAYDWAKHGDGNRQTTDWKVFYPDGLQQVWAVAFGLVPAPVADSLMTKFVTLHPAWSAPATLDLYNSGPARVDYRSIVGWALSSVGKTAEADAGQVSIRAAAALTGRAWPFTPGDAGQLALLRSGANGYLSPGYIAGSTGSTGSTGSSRTKKTQSQTLTTVLAAEVTPAPPAPLAAPVSMSPLGHSDHGDGSRSPDWLVLTLVLAVVSATGPLRWRMRRRSPAG